jgi:excisionase family DNA binding protein
MAKPIELSKSSGTRPTQATSNNGPLLKPPEAAKYIHVSKRTLMTYCRKRLIAHHQYKGGRGGFRFRQTDLDAFLQRTYVPAKAA